MKEKILIFIPYQDTDNYYSDGIMTREYAMLYMLYKAGYKKIINVKKPRTILDKKKYNINNNYFLEGTKEAEIKEMLDFSKTIQYLPLFSFSQIIQKRGWWINSYKNYINKINIEQDKEYLVYSDNPFACELIIYLYQKGCKVYFDIMDNFVIHPSLSESEHNYALIGYKKIFNNVNVISANSAQTCEYMKKYTNNEILLVKNGVFKNNEINEFISINEVNFIRKNKTKYKTCVGYIGKLGLRLDADLIDAISNECKEVLFVFVGDYLTGQINSKLVELFNTRENLIHINGVPSSYVYPILNEFDILSIPHSVGKNENGGDPLKLYQYLTRNKKIITTPILGVDEFNDKILITDDIKKWIDCINDGKKDVDYTDIDRIFWNERIKPVLNIILENGE